MQQVSILRAIKAVNFLGNKPNSHAYISNDILYYWSKNPYISKNKAKKDRFKGWCCKEYKIIYDSKLTIELINKFTLNKNNQITIMENKMNIEDLLKRKKELKNELNSINHQISNYKDGFEYVVCVHSYGSHWKERFNNLDSALILTNEYYEDNGFAHLYTNNPNVKIRLQGGDVYFIEDTSKINAFKHPENAVIVYTEEDLKNECDLNSFENQGYEG